MTIWQRLFPWLRPSPPRPPGPIPPISLGGLDNAINLYRAEVGRPALSPEEEMSRIARDWAQTMSRIGRLSHGPFYKLLQMYYGDRVLGAAENVAFGQVDEIACVSSWANSAGHRVNMVGDWTHIGTGRAVGRDGRPFWCAIFARLR